MFFAALVVNDFQLGSIPTATPLIATTPAYRQALRKCAITRRPKAPRAHCSNDMWAAASAFPVLERPALS